MSDNTTIPQGNTGHACPTCGFPHGGIHVGPGSFSVGHGSPVNYNDFEAMKAAFLDPARRTMRHYDSKAQKRHEEDCENHEKTLDAVIASKDELMKAAEEHRRKPVNPLQAMCATRERRRCTTIAALFALVITILVQIALVIKVGGDVDTRAFGSAAVDSLGVIMMAGLQAFLAGLFAPLIYAEYVAGAVFERKDQARS